MKILKCSAIGIGVLALLYCVAALLMPPTHYETRFEVDKPVNIVWKLFTDESRLAEWLEDFKSLEPISGEPNQVGSKYRLTFEEAGVMEEELLTFVENQEFSFRLSHPWIVSNVVVRFQELGGRTTIITENEVQGCGLIRPLIPFMSSCMEECQQRSYAKLKALIEAESS